ncbi:MAG: NUDIX hydrolase [Saprospiraceae bacterium]|nr:NUDIX hydrolase [Saprospiraceae bacterium]
MAEFSQDFFKNAVTVDNVIFGFDESDLKVLLIKRGTEPYTGLWALPGDFIYADENIENAASRILYELTGLDNVYLEQVRTFGAVGRHPLGRVLTVAYFSLVKINHYDVHPSSFAQTAQWVKLAELRNSPLAFDHNAILDACFNALKQRVRVRPIGFELLPPKFTLTELQHLYEAILEADLDKRNFRKKILSMDFIVDLNESQEGVAHRPARLYEFDKLKYEKFVSEGFNFEL